MKGIYAFIGLVSLSLSFPILANEGFSEPAIIYKNNVAIGYTSARSPFTKSGSGCAQFAGRIKVEGLQFSDSGATLKSFWFVDGKDNNWSVPTEFESLPNNLLRSNASSFIKKDKPYFIRLEACGSGGFVTLIDIYNEKAVTENIN